MFKYSTLALVMGVFVGCGSKDSSDSGAEGAEDQSEGTRVPEQEGRWAVTDGSWTDDQCNGPMTLVAPTSMEISDSLPGSFTMNFLNNGVDIIDAPVECTLQGDDYVCAGGGSTWSIDGMDVNITLTGVNTLTFSSESTVSGRSDLEMTCAGSDCQEAGDYYGITSPCTTTYNWMGTYTPE